MNIKNKSQFIEYFLKGIKKPNQLKIGVEHERFLFEGQNKKRISYITLKKLFENRSEEHTSELQSRSDLVCRLLLEKQKNKKPEHKHRLIQIY